LTLPHIISFIIPVNNHQSSSSKSSGYYYRNKNCSM